MPPTRRRKPIEVVSEAAKDNQKPRAPKSKQRVESKRAPKSKQRVESKRADQYYVRKIVGQALDKGEMLYEVDWSGMFSSLIIRTCLFNKFPLF